MARDITLPGSVIGAAELSRICRDIEDFETAAQQAKLRAKTAGVAVVEVRPTRRLQQVAAANDCDLHQAGPRHELASALESLQKSAPTVTLSFAVEPSVQFLAKLVDWFRGSIDPHVLVKVGLQPNITAGFILRTPAKVYDFSLEHKFNEQRGLLMERIRAAQDQPELTGEPDPAMAEANAGAVL